MRRAGRISGCGVLRAASPRLAGRRRTRPSGASFVVGRAQDRRGVHGCDDRRQVAGRIVHDAAAAQDAELRSQERLRRDRAHQDEHVGRDDVDLGAQPRPAGDDVGSQRTLVEPALAARLPAEVLDGVGQVDAAAIDARTFERVVEHASRRAHERPALDVLVVARLLADEREARLAGPLAEYDLRASLPEIAAAAVRGGRAQGGQAVRVRDELRCTWELGHSSILPAGRDPNPVVRRQMAAREGAGATSHAVASASSRHRAQHRVARQPRRVVERHRDPRACRPAALRGR